MAIPDAINDLTVSIIGFSQVTLTWTVPGDGGSPITDYLVEFSIDNDIWNIFEHNASIINSIIVDSLENNITNFFRVSAINGDGTATPSNIITAIPQNTPIPEYCSVNDIADWLRIDITETNDPTVNMIEEFILVAQEFIDRRTGHTWQSEKQKRNEIHNVPENLWDYGQGIPLFNQHRMIKTPFDTTKGDKFEIWNGLEWIFQEDVSEDANFIHYDKVSGTFYIRGYYYTILTKKRFRLTYRYGGDQENELIPRDIKRAAILLVAIDILQTDFAMSQIPIGGEGNINKAALIDKWQAMANEIIDDHKEWIVINN